MNSNPKIAVIGLGYVGLPLAVEFSKIHKTIGFDKNNERIKELRNGIDKTLELTDEQLGEANLEYTVDSNKIAQCNIFIITVPTPVDKNNQPNMYPLESSSNTVGRLLKKDDIVIYESTVYPGATEEFCVPILEKQSGLKYNKDFFCGYSPERINPGDKKHSLKTIVKVTSGSNDKTAEFVDKLYKSIITAGTHKVSSIAVAEAAKVIENIQRDVNIALINELSIIFNKINLETIEVLRAAGTKWNFLPFRPGLVGGHCIGVDPYYMTYKAAQIGYNPEIILAGRRINDKMGKYIADSTISEIKNLGISSNKAKIAIFGLSFKENCPDLRNSKVNSVVSNLKDHGCEVLVTDIYANVKEAKDIYDIDLVPINDIKEVDAIVLAVGHSKYELMKQKEWLKLFKKKGIFIDVKSIFDNNYFNATNIKHWKL